MFKPTVFSLVLVAVFLSTASALLHKITFYSLPNQGGVATTFTSKTADVLLLQPSVQSAKSYCMEGWWYFYGQPNYLGTIFNNGSTTTRKCFNDASIPLKLKSFRYPGPPDMDTVSITWFETTDVYGAQEGKEMIVQAPAANNFPFVSNGMSIITTGASKWTIYENNDFTGNSRCMDGHWNPISTHFNGFPFRSVLKGC